MDSVKLLEKASHSKYSESFGSKYGVLSSCILAFATFVKVHINWLFNVPLAHQPFLQVHQQVEQAVPFFEVFLQDLPGMETHHHHHKW